MTLQIRSNSSDPLTETARLVDRFPITTDEQWSIWKSQGHCGKPATAYSLYCDNHEPMHHSDNPAIPAIQAIDNRPGGRQRVVMCAHVTTPKPSNDKPQTPAMHTPTMNATTNVQKGQKEITMSTTNNTPAVNLDAIAAQIAALNAALAALSTPAQAPANVTTTPANVTTTPATPTTQATTPTAPAVIIEFSGALSGAMTANAANATTGNHGWRGQCKATGIDGQKYQVSFQAWLVGGNPAKPPTTKAVKK